MANSEINKTHRMLSAFNQGGCKDWSLYNKTMKHYDQQLRIWEAEDKAFQERIARIRAMRGER